MAGNFLLAVPSNFDAPLMYETTEQQGCNTVDSSASTLGSSVTACKKVLCSSGLLDSTEYWLRNERMLCRIGFVEDKAENNCATICFVNLDGGKEDCTNDEFKQKLISVSPDLPKLINSLNVQQPKDNEIFLLSGLASPGDSQGECDSPQCSRLADVCLVQCARGHRNNASCIIFEINKFLIGLEFIQERQLLLEGNSNLKPEDDTNCSVSSIEEDFLTASEHLEDENEGDDFQTGSEKQIYPLGEDSLSKDSFASDELAHCSEETLTVVTEELPLQRMDKAVQQLHSESDSYVKDYFVANSSETFRISAQDSYALDESRENCSAKVVRDTLNHQCDVIPQQIDKTRPEAVDYKSSYNTLKYQQPDADQYATNLEESVLQDAFIRLSQSEPTFTTKAAASISVGNNTLLSATKADVSTPSRSWNELPKIVIVQSPDSGGHLSEYHGISSSSATTCDLMNPMITSDNPHHGDIDINSTSTCGHQNSVKVALACAANIIGTISSPHAVERLKLEQNITDLKDSDEEHETDTETELTDLEYMETNYSVSSALCGMTQVASAVAAAGCGTNEVNYHTASTGLLAAAETSTAITLHCSVAIGSSLEQFTDSIADVLFKEASRILIKPDDYKSVGEFIETMSSKITETVKGPRIPKLKEKNKDEFVQNLSNVILKHSVEEANKKIELTDEHSESSSGLNAQGLFIETAHDLLFDVLHFTCKRISDVARQSNVSTIFSEETNSWRVFEGTEKRAKKNLQDKLDCPCISQTSHFKNENNLSERDNGNSTSSTKEENQDQFPDSMESTILCPTLFCHGNKSINNCQDVMGHVGSYQCNIATANKDFCKLQNQLCKQNNKGTSPCLECDKNIITSEYKHTDQDLKTNDKGKNRENKQKHKCDVQLNNEINMTLLNTSHTLYPSQHLFQITYPTSNCTVAHFADELATTVVSMATEMAAICLENSNGKQPWFCAWKRGTEYLAPQTISCRTKKRKKDTQPNPSVVRKHRAPRLSEIKRKTEKHPELKERLMNRVVDESMNFDDVPDSVTIFNNEVSAKILSLTELPVIDSARQGQTHPRNRLHCERWNRGKPSSYESIPEEDADSARLLNTLGPMSSLGQPISRGSSVSKQSSCESITDEFSRFMVNQMESEGREFDLLLDYYAGKNANTILNSAMQQVTKKNGHLNIRSSSPSKQSSTESITEEFYRYMLRELDKENKENATMRSTKEWSNNLLNPSVRTPFCFRQASMPDSRSADSRLTVNAPVKAKSFDGFAQSTRSDTLNIQQSNSASSSPLCKSDSCLYRRCKTDEITDMLIHETWSTSIEALMRKNKIIADDNESTDLDMGPSGSQPHVEQFANKLAADIVECGKSFIGVHHDSTDYTNRDSVKERRQFVSLTDIYLKQPAADKANLTVEKDCFTANDPVTVCKPSLPHCPREVPLIHIEGDQREEFGEYTENCISDIESSGTKNESLYKEITPEVDCKKNNKPSSLIHCSHITNKLVTELVEEARTTEESPNNLSSSDESTGSWSQLINDDENPDDTSSYLQLSERSMSNGNSSTSSSLGTVDLEGYQENTAPCIITSALRGKKEFLMEHQENLDECTSGLSVGTSTGQKDIIVINFDLKPDCADSELRATLQWIAASELGIPTIYFRKSQEKRIEKFLDVVHLVHRKAWKVGDLFHAVLQYCKQQEENGGLTTSLFDWLLEFR